MESTVLFLKYLHYIIFRNFVGKIPCKIFGQSPLLGYHYYPKEFPKIFPDSKKYLDIEMCPKYFNQFLVDIHKIYRVYRELGIQYRWFSLHFSTNLWERKPLY